MFRWREKVMLLFFPILLPFVIARCCSNSFAGSKWIQERIGNLQPMTERVQEQSSLLILLPSHHRWGNTNDSSPHDVSWSIAVDALIARAADGHCWSSSPRLCLHRIGDDSTLFG